jgi:cytoskeletal protein CcmA (bactofilin family)
MFEKLSNKKMASASEKFDTLIGRTTTIQGNLILLESVRIDGKVVGNIVADQSGKIGPMGEVVGDISAHRIMVAGKVTGHIYASERVEFQKDAIVHGDISYGSISVEHGANISGLVLQINATDQSAAGAQTAIYNAQALKDGS